MIDLSTNYLGMRLKNPIIVSASPLSENVDNVRRMEDAGAAGVVLHSLFEEQITMESEILDAALMTGENCFPEALSYFPDLTDYNLGPEGYLEHIRRVKAAVDIPVIASLNGVSRGGWIRYARKMQEAGADALELNIYHIPTDPTVSGAEVEKRYIDLVKDVRQNITIPFAVKISPFFSSIGNMGMQLAQAGANGLVLFNRFYQPDLDIERLEVNPNLELSDSRPLRLRLRWVAYMHGRVKADFAITGGVHTAADVLKSMMAGANVVMIASSLFQNGIDHILTLRDDVLEWMNEHEYDSIEQMQGSMSAHSVAEPDAYARGNYMRVLSSYAWRQPGRIAGR